MFQIVLLKQNNKTENSINTKNVRNMDVVRPPVVDYRNYWSVPLCYDGGNRLIYSELRLRHNSKL